MKIKQANKLVMLPTLTTDRALGGNVSEKILKSLLASENKKILWLINDVNLRVIFGYSANAMYLANTVQDLEKYPPES